MIKKARKIVKTWGAAGLAVLIGFSVPFLIWAAAVFCITHIYREWRAIRAGLLAGNLACGLDTDCPPGYVCSSGRCTPENAA